jgi:DNA-binding LacI/PurR family transcriptional regulator
MAKLKEIAKVLGVSLSTVSKALRDTQDLNEETKSYIQRIAKILNYKSKEKAEKSKKKDKYIIGIVCPEIKSNYYSKLLEVLHESFQIKGHGVFVGFSNFELKEEIFQLHTFMERGLDGIAFITEGTEIQNILAQINKKNPIPLVLVASRLEINEVDCININDSFGVTLAIKYLTDMGHKEIGYMGDRFSEDRLNTFLNYMKENKLDVKDEYIWVLKERFEECGYQAMKEALCIERLPSAFFCAYDDIAIGAMRAAYEAKLRIPDDISFIGIDNIMSSPYLFNALSTVTSPIEQMGKTVSGILLGKIEDPENKVCQQITLNPYLVKRETVKKIK